MIAAEKFDECRYLKAWKASLGERRDEASEHPGLLHNGDIGYMLPRIFGKNICIEGQEIAIEDYVKTRAEGIMRCPVIYDRYSRQKDLRANKVLVSALTEMGWRREPVSKVLQRSHMTIRHLLEEINNAGDILVKEAVDQILSELRSLQVRHYEPGSRQRDLLNGYFCIYHILRFHVRGQPRIISEGHDRNRVERIMAAMLRRYKWSAKDISWVRGCSVKKTQERLRSFDKQECAGLDIYFRCIATLERERRRVKAA